MRTCPNCGQSVADDAMFCGNCGTPIPAASAAPPAQGTPVFCSNCGERLAAGTAFCPNCGAPVQSAQAPAPAPKKKNTALAIGIAAAAVAAVALVAVVFWLGSRLFTSPSKQFISYHQALIIDMLLDGVEDVGDACAADSFSSTLTLTGEVDDAQINGYLRNSSIGLDLGLKGGSLVANGSLTLMGSEVLSGTVTYDDGVLGFQLPQVDDNYYVIDVGELMQDMTGRSVDVENIKRPKISGKQLRSLVEAYLDIVYTTVNDDNVEMERNEKVRLPGLGGSFTGTVYTFVPTAGDIENMIDKLADHLEKDEELRGLALQFLEAANAVSVLDAYSSSSTPKDALEDALLDAVDGLRDHAREIGRAVEQADFKWVLAVEDDNVRMIKITAGSDNGLSYEADGESSDADGRQEMLSVLQYGEQALLLERDYTRKGSSSEGAVTVTIPYEGSLTFRYEMDTSKKSVFGIPYGEYTLSMPGEDIRVKLEVAAGQHGGADHTVTINTDSYYSDFNYIKVNLNATDGGSAKKPSQKPTDINDLSSSELEDLVYSIVNVIQMELISNLLPGYYGW